MSNTFRHKINAKFNAGLISAKQAGISVNKMWDRKNGDWGEFRKKRIEKRIKAISSPPTKLCDD